MIRRISKDELDEVLFEIKPFVFKKNLILSANFLRIGIPNFSLDYLVQKIIKVLKCKYLAIQSYSEFIDRENRSFSRYNSPVNNSLSNLSKYIFSKYPQCRILSATHSFIVLGISNEKLNHIFTSAFGQNSSFSFFLEENFTWLNLGSFLSETCTFLHHVESTNIDIIKYRYEVDLPVIIYPDIIKSKKIAINYTYLDKSKDFLDLNYNWNPIENHESFINNKFKNNYFPISFYNLEELMLVGSKVLKSNPFALTNITK